MASLETIKDILQENLEIDPASVDMDSTIESLGIDSLDLLELTYELEERLNIEDFGSPENLNTVGDLVTYVDSLLA